MSARLATASAAVAGQDHAIVTTLYDSLGANKKSNVFFSPVSIDAVLGMLAHGAKGTTQTKLYKVIGSDEKTSRTGRLQQLGGGHEGNVTLNVANGLFVDSKFTLYDQYRKTLIEDYAAEAKEYDFVNSPEVSRKAINEWVSVKTETLIKDLLAQGTVGCDTKLVLANAIYFKGMWGEAFEKSKTEQATFYTPSESAPDTFEVFPTMMMKQTGSFKFVKYSELEANVLELPYKGDRVSMVIIEPSLTEADQTPSPLALTQLEAKLGAPQGGAKEGAQITFRDVLTKLDSAHKQRVIVKMPRFKLEVEYDLMKELRNVDIPWSGDYTGIGYSRTATGEKILEQLEVSAAIHKAFVEVDEEGTRAAAATAIGIRSVAFVEEPEVNLNKPFIFLIRDKLTDTIVFAGRVTKPEAAVSNHPSVDTPIDSVQQ